MKILVTGYKGFIGQNMVKFLEKEHIVSTYDYNGTVPDVSNLDWVVHLGAISATTERNVEKVMTQNYDFSVKLLQACYDANVNFQYSSSASVYGQTTNFSEDAPCHPQSPYSWSKYLFDRYVSSIEHPVLVQGFRYFNVYGPGEDHKGSQASVFYNFTKQAETTGVIKVFENSQHYYRDFVPVDRVLRIHRDFFDINFSGIWNIGTGEARSFMDVAKEIAQLHNAKIELVPMPEELKAHYQQYTKADLTKLINTLHNVNKESRG
jgi:ADP-L-glycero-D-manno-heptose 6-epimerase